MLRQGRGGSASSKLLPHAPLTLKSPAYRDPAMIEDTIGALAALNGQESVARDQCLETFRQRFEADKTVIIEWLRLFCGTEIAGNTAKVCVAAPASSQAPGGLAGQALPAERLPSALATVCGYHPQITVKGAGCAADATPRR